MNSTKEGIKRFKQHYGFINRESLMNHFGIENTSRSILNFMHSIQWDYLFLTRKDLYKWLKKKVRREVIDAT